MLKGESSFKVHDNLTFYFFPTVERWAGVVHVFHFYRVEELGTASYELLTKSLVLWILGNISRLCIYKVRSASRVITKRIDVKRCDVYIPIKPLKLEILDGGTEIFPVKVNIYALDYHVRFGFGIIAIVIVLRHSVLSFETTVGLLL